MSSTADLRRQNRNRVYRYLYELPEPTTRQAMAMALQMSLPTLTHNLKELEKMGLIDTSETTDSTGGRKPRLVVPLTRARFAVGAEMTRGHIRLIAVDLKLQELAFQDIQRPFSNDEEYARLFARDLEAFLDRAQLERERLLGVGLTLPGVIASDGETVEFAPSIHLRHAPAGHLTAAIPYPVHLENDAAAGGFAERWNRPELTHMVYLSVGRGIGGAILVDGQTYQGAERRAGEFGHMCVRPEGLPCACGQRGCLEAQCSMTRLSDELGLAVEEFFDLVDQGSLRECAIWSDYLDDLAIGIDNIHTALDCDVVLGGALSQYIPRRMAGLEQRLRQRAPFGFSRNYLHLCAYGAKSNPIGAALHYIHAFLQQV